MSPHHVKVEFMRCLELQRWDAGCSRGVRFPLMLDQCFYGNHCISRTENLWCESKEDDDSLPNVRTKVSSIKSLAKI